MVSGAPSWCDKGLAARGGGTGDCGELHAAGHQRRADMERRPK